MDSVKWYLSKRVWTVGLSVAFGALALCGVEIKVGSEEVAEKILPLVSALVGLAGWLYTLRGQRQIEPPGILAPKPPARIWNKPGAVGVWLALAALALGLTGCLGPLSKQIAPYKAAGAVTVDARNAAFSPTVNIPPDYKGPSPIIALTCTGNFAEHGTYKIDSTADTAANLASNKGDRSQLTAPGTIADDGGTSGAASGGENANQPSEVKPTTFDLNANTSLTGTGAATSTGSKANAKAVDSPGAATNATAPNSPPPAASPAPAPPAAVLAPSDDVPALPADVSAMTPADRAALLAQLRDYRDAQVVERGGLDLSADAAAIRQNLVDWQTANDRIKLLESK